MSDFLGHLVARSLRPQAGFADGGILRPRLPSMFEQPVTGATPLPLGDETVEETVVVRRPIPIEGDEADQTSRVASRERSIPAKRAQAPIDAEAPSDEGRESEVVPKPVVLVPTTSEDPMEARQVPAAPLRVHAVPPREPTPVVPTLAKMPTTVEKTTPPPRSNIHPIPRPRGPQTKGRGAQTVQPLRPELGDVGQASENNGFAQQEASGPLVRIHIGRIEVRAVTTPPAPARKPPPLRPKLGLDDYLRRRDEGKR